MLAYNPNYEKVKIDLMNKQIKNRLVRFNTYLQGKEFLNNGKLCYYDFFFYEILNVVNDMDP